MGMYTHGSHPTWKNEHVQSGFDDKLLATTSGNHPESAFLFMAFHGYGAENDCAS